MNNFRNYLKLHVNSPKTIKLYLCCILNYFNKHKEFNQENINLYLTCLVDRNKKSAFNLAISSFKKYALFTKINIEFPKQKKITRKNVTSLSRDEIENEIFPYFDILFKDAKKRKTIFRFMMLSLMRVGEIINLKKEDINFKTRQILIKHAKGDKHRITFLHSTIKEDIFELINKSKTEYAFNIKYAYFEYMFLKINTELHYKKHITPHTTRRAGGKFLRKNGVELEYLKEMYGHESLETTGKYLISDTDEIQEAYNKVKYKKG